MITAFRAGLPALFAFALVASPVFAQDGTPPATMPPAATGAPSNEVGQKFEIPKVGGREQQVELIAGLCGVQMKGMAPPACKCLAEQAMTSLSDPQRDYLIASVVAPPVADRMLNDHRVGQTDQEAIFRFINATSDGCASGTFDAARAKAAAMPMTPVVPEAGAAPAVPTPAPAN